MAVNENGTFAYKYNLTDYMGNVRTYAVADRSSETLLEEQVMDYYPFGLAHSYNNLHKNRYLFSGKELQDASLGRHGFLELYDFGARYYNPMSGRWFNPDPALQTVNPYLFAGISQWYILIKTENSSLPFSTQSKTFFMVCLHGIGPVKIGIPLSWHSKSTWAGSKVISDKFFLDLHGNYRKRYSGIWAVKRKIYSKV